MTKTVIELIGGDDKLRELVETFYDEIETNPLGENIAKLHLRGHGLNHVRTEQFNFLSGFLGGRRYYEEKHRHMDVRLMHAHVPISTEDAENWLKCMDIALDHVGMEGPHIDRLRQVFRRIALMLVNDLDAWGVPKATAGRA